MGTKHALAQIAHFGLLHVDLAAQAGNLGLVLGHTRLGLGQFMLVSPFNPQGGLRRRFMHPTPVAGVVAQLNIPLARHPHISRPRNRHWPRGPTLNHR